MNDQQTARMGADSQIVLDNPAYKLAMETLKSAVVQQWKDCPVRDREGQMLLLQLAKLTDKFDGILMGLVQNGKMAQHKIDLDKLRDESKGRQFLRRVSNG